MVPTSAVALSEPGEMTLTKTAVPVDTSDDNREFEITLSVQGSELTTKAPVDVVLVLDTSGSMDEETDVVDYVDRYWDLWSFRYIYFNVYKTRLQVVQEAAIDFANSILDENDNAKVSIVSYAGSKGENRAVSEDNITYNTDTPYNDASSIIDLTDNRDSIEDAIDELSAEGGTNIEAGFYEARQQLETNGRENSEKVVILMSDGEPTFAYTEDNVQIDEGFWSRNSNISDRAWTKSKRVGFIIKHTEYWYPGEYETKSGITYGHGNAYNSEYKDKAIAEAFRAKEDPINAKIFTVGLTASTEMTTNIRAVLNPEGINKYQEQYFEATDSDGISEAFADISNQINAVAKNAVIVDTINEDFELVNGTADDAVVDGQKLTWEIGDIFDGAKSVSFRVRAKEDIYGAAYTNDAAYLYFDITDANTHYASDEYNNQDSSIEREKRLTFEKPVVEVPPIAANDDNYQVKVGTTLEATTPALSVLNNDPSVKKHDVDGWDTEEVIAEKMTDPEKGTIEFNDDGTFTYISNEDASGTDTFTYDIVTTVQKGEEDPITLRDTATVTITIIPTYALTVVYKEIEEDGGATLIPAEDPNTNKSYAAGEEYSIAVPEISDYNYVGPEEGSNLTGTMPEDNLIVTLLYEKKTVGSTIVYYEDGVKIESIDGPSGKWGSSQKLEDDQINKHLPEEGYSVSGNPSDYILELDKDSSKNVYRIDYTVNQYDVVVEYYYKNNLATPFKTDDESYGGTNAPDYGSEIDVAAISDVAHINGTYDRDDDETTSLFTVGADEDKNVIKIVYVSHPNAVDDIISTDANVPVEIDVLDNDSDPLDLDSDLEILPEFTGPDNGSVVLDNGKFTYTPDVDFIGEDSFVYGIKNEFGKTDSATVTITITIKPWQPISVRYLEEGTSNDLRDAFTTSLREGTILADVEGLDIDQPDIEGFTKRGIKDDLVIPSGMPGKPLEITYLYSRNDYDYTINYYYKNSGDFIESKTITVPYESVIKAVDDSEQVDLKTYDRFDVTGLDLIVGTDPDKNVINVYYAAAPQAVDDAATINPGETITIDVLDNDSDIDGKEGELKVKSVSQPAVGQGSTSFDEATGEVTYIPADELADTVVTFEYTIEDAQGLTSTAEVTITIRPYYNLSVKYVESDNETNVIGGQDTVHMKYQQEFEIVSDMISGYVYDDNVTQNLSGTMPEADHEVVVYYRRASIGYNVEYYYENSVSETPFAYSEFTALYEDTLYADDIADYSALTAGYERFRVVFPSQTGPIVLAAESFWSNNTADSLTISANPEENIVKVYYAAEPVAVDDAITINPNQTVLIDVLDNDIDLDGHEGELKIDSITQPASGNGSVSFDEETGVITFIPEEDDSDSVIIFSYSIIDAQGQTSEATVTVSIRPFYTLTVYYRETGNDSVELAEPVSEESLVFGQEYEATVITIDGFEPADVVESRPVTGFGLEGEMPEQDLAIIIRYDQIPDPTLPVIEVIDSEIPLAEPTPKPTLPEIELIEESVPLAEPSPVPTIEVVQEEIPQSGEKAPLWPIGLGLLVIAGGIYYILHRKEQKEQ